MIEAATASISTSQMIRSAVEQSSSAQTIAANPARIQKVAVNNAPYLSPYVRLAPNTKPILVVRDSDTGAQVNQYPTPAQIRAYQAAQSAQAKLSTTSSSTAETVQTAQGDVKQVSYDEAKAVLQSSVQYQEIKKEAARAASSDAPAPQPQPERPTSVSVDA